LRPLALHVEDLAVRSGIASSGPAVDQPPACAGCRVFGGASGQILQPSSSAILRLCRRPTSDLHRILHPSAVPAICLRLLSSFALSGLTFQSTFGLRRRPILQPCLRTQPPNLLVCCISGSAFPSVCDLRRLPTLQPCLRTQPPALTGCCRLRLRLPVDLRLASATNPPALPLNSTSDSLGCRILRLRLPTDLRLAPPVNLPTSPSELQLRRTASSSVEKNSRTRQPVHASANQSTSVDICQVNFCPAFRPLHCRQTQEWADLEGSAHTLISSHRLPERSSGP
jgi:hypothetical protein